MKLKSTFTNIIKTIASIPSRILQTLRNILIELRLVDWLRFNKVAKSTIVIIVIAVLVTVLVAGIDQVLVTVRGFLFNRTLI